MKKQTQILPLQGWRLFFAMGVVFSHLPYPEGMSSWAPYGDLGVTFFLILSGYLSARSNTSIRTEYYKKKFWHIYPIHWFALSLALIIYIPTRSYWNEDTWWILLLNATLMQGYYPNAEVNIAFNGPTWFLSTILLFYFLLPYLQRLHTKLKSIFYLLTILMLGFSLFFKYITMDKSWEIAWWGTGFFPPVRIAECMLGMCLFDIKKRKMGTFTEVMALILLLGTRITAPYAPAILNAYWWIPAMLFIVWVFANSDGCIAKVLSSNSFVCGGNLTMDIYMFHYLAVRCIPSIEYFLGELSFYCELCFIAFITTCMIVVWRKVINVWIQALRKKYSTM